MLLAGGLADFISYSAGRDQQNCYYRSSLTVCAVLFNAVGHLSRTTTHPRSIAPHSPPFPLMSHTDWLDRYHGTWTSWSCVLTFWHTLQILAYRGSSNQCQSRFRSGLEVGLGLAYYRTSSLSLCRAAERKEGMRIRTGIYSS